MSVYAYGVVGGKKPGLEAVPRGVPSTGPLRALTIAVGMHLVVADADSDVWSESAIETGLRDIDWVSERALRHDEVLSHFLAADALVPMKAFTLFASDESALEHVKARQKSVKAILDRVAGCVEWGVRMRFDAAAVKVAATPKKKPSSGAAFLEAKKSLQDAARTGRQSAYAAARAAAEKLAALAEETVVVPAPDVRGTTPLLLEVALLVQRGRREELERLADGMAPALKRAGVEIELTGPWAPFHFATEPT